MGQIDFLKFAKPRSGELSKDRVKPYQINHQKKTAIISPKKYPLLRNVLHSGKVF